MPIEAWQPWWSQTESLSKGLEPFKTMSSSPSECAERPEGGEAFCGTAEISGLVGGKKKKRQCDLIKVAV